MPASPEDFELGIPGFRYSDLHQPLRLRALHETFWAQAEQATPGLNARFEAAHAQGTKPPVKSEALIEVASAYSAFLTRLFRIETPVAEIRRQTQALDPIFRFKNEFLKTRVFRRLEEPAMAETDFSAWNQAVQQILRRDPFAPLADPEAQFGRLAVFIFDCAKKIKKEALTADEARHAETLLPGPGELSARLESAVALLENWCAQVAATPQRRRAIAGWVSYTRPHKLDFDNLVPMDKVHPRARDGFKLTDPRMSVKQVLREVDYCIYCHQREKDSCSHGFPDKDGTFKRNPLGIELKGCPLDERISEMHWLRKHGDPIAALGMVTLDNPMCPGTGHRICNECMKGCIFQKQDPVNIPENETGILTEVLALPYGFEIYGLMTRWNPLSRERPYPLPYHGKNVLVVGLGPAGYTLCHYLSKEGFGVVGIDGLKLEPLSDDLTGFDRPFPRPVRDYRELHSELDSRVLTGFGGVSEYGITVRWDKNFLNVIYLTLLRRQNIRFYGGTRFGGTLRLEDAWNLGFDHVALATGAGRPTLVPMKNNLSRGVRKASDFLMSLQLSGAFKKDFLANLHLELPAVVIGGGLTAFDTATEMLAYYPVQAERLLHLFESLDDKAGAFASLTGAERVTLETILGHARELREERARAQAENRAPQLALLCQRWGGVRVVYRKRLQDSPAYRLNHEEVHKAFEEGIEFIGDCTPVEVEKNAEGAAVSLVCKTADGSLQKIPARSIAVAAGTQPNTIYEKEYPGTFQLDGRGRFFAKHTATAEGLAPAAPGQPGFFLSYAHQGRYVSYYGDNHPDYAGNVVKAMASAKHGAPHVARLFSSAIRAAEGGQVAPQPFVTLREKLDRVLLPTVVRVDRLTPKIVEVIVHAPYAADKFEPGQFFRLQNYETLAETRHTYRRVMEGLALTGAWVDRAKGWLSLIVLEMGASSKLCATLKPGDPVVVMGPTGAPSEIPKNENVLLAGGGLGNAVLLSISQALRANGCRVIYFAGYREAADVFHQSQIEAATDQMVWAVDSGETIRPQRPQDLTFRGNIVEAMIAYASGQLQQPPLFDFSQLKHLLVIGSDRMMAAVAKARHGLLKRFLDPKHVALGSINSPMQCMMKEVCAQCLQRHVDPVTGEETFVFSCYNQDQPLDAVDFTNLRDRLQTNSLEEKLSLAFIEKELGHETRA